MRLGSIKNQITRQKLEAEFNRLYEENRQMVFGLAWRLTGNEDAAKDIEQKTFLTLHMKIEKILNHPNPNGWLIKTVHYYVKHYKREQAYRLQHEIPLELAEQVAVPQLNDEREMFIDSLPNWLSDTEKKMLTLYYCYGYTLREISGKLGITYGGTRTRMARLLGKMREQRPDKVD